LIYLTPTVNRIMIIYFPLLGFFTAALACSTTLPNIQIVVKVNNDNPPLIQVFNIPLFDDDCFYQLPAKPVDTNGK
jgi:hypothetical protein